MLRKGMVLLLLLFGMAQVAVATQLTPRLRQFTETDGLSNPIVKQVEQDQQGYLWLVVRDGLVRYDGRAFTPWKQDELGECEVMAMHIDSQDRIWVGCHIGGLVVLDPSREHFRFLDQGGQSQLAKEYVYSIASDKQGRLLAATLDALYRIAADGVVTRFAYGEDIPEDAWGSVVFGASDGNTFIINKDAAMRWTATGFERLPLGKVSIEGYLPGEYGEFVIFTEEGVRTRKSDGTIVSGPTFQAYPKSDSPLWWRDRDGQYWRTVQDGMVYGDPGNMRRVHFYSRTRQSEILPDLLNIYEDREGGLWITSMVDGLWYLPGHWKRFSVLHRYSNDLRISLHTEVLALSREGGVWMVGDSGGLDYFDPESGAVVRKVDDFGLRICNHSVHEDRNGRVWITCHDGLVRFDPRSGAKKVWPYHWDYVQNISETPDGTLWFYSRLNGRLHARDSEGGILLDVDVSRVDGKNTGFRGKAMAPGADGKLWMLGDAGLLAFDRESSRLVQVAGAPQEKLNSFVVSADGSVWIGVEGRIEKYQWDGQALKRLERIDARHGFPKVKPVAIMRDRAGIIWVPSQDGLVRVDPVSKAVRLYTVNDGMPGNFFYRNGLVQSKTGDLVGSTTEGIVVFDPERLQAQVDEKQVQSNLVIDSISLNRGPKQADTTRQSPLLMKHDDRDLSVTARLLSYAAPEFHNYRFMLRGYEDGWVEVGATGERSFSILPVGDYRLEVQGKAAGGEWTEARSLDIRVMPAWWGSAWGIALFVFSGILFLLWCAYLYLQWFNRRNAWRLARHRQTLAEQASEAKTRFLATLGHEVRTPMTGVLGMSELLLATSLDDKQRRYTNSIRHAGTHLLQLVNDALDLARIEAGRLELDKQPFDLRQTMGEVVALMAPLAQNKNLAFNEENASPGPMIVIGDVVRVRQVLLNLVGNAVKFTEAGSVTVRMQPLKPEGIRFEVSDTGPGINVEQQKRLFERFEQAEGGRTAARYGGSGLGLAICQELTVAMGGHIGVESKIGMGSRFIVDLPLPWSRADARAQAVNRGQGAHDLRALRVLLVEDDPTVAEVIVGLLQVRGHRVRHAPHSLAALSESVSEQFDVALLDLDLPGMNGLALAAQLQASGYTMPLIAVTARADADAEPEAREAGFDGFLRKPLTGDMLIEAIAAVLVVD